MTALNWPRLIIVIGAGVHFLVFNVWYRIILLILLKLFISFIFTCLQLFICIQFALALFLAYYRSLIIGLWFACCSLLNLRLLIFILCFCRTYFAYLVFVFGVTQFFAYYVCILFWNFHAFGAHTLIYIYVVYLYFALTLLPHIHFA